MIGNIIKKIVLVVTLGSACAVANAAPITYLGADDQVSSVNDMVNAASAKADFLGVAGSLNTFGFESPIPSGLMITGGATVNSSCGSVCGFNTTNGGSNWHQVSGGRVTFTFVDPLDAFGFFVNGLQTDLVSQQTITYTDGDGAQQVINFPSAINGGGAFVGFIDFGSQISSVTFDATGDILGFDDLMFGRSERDPNDPNDVPAPSVLFLLVAGIFAARSLKK